MPKDRRRFTREDPDSRKDALIRATLSLMAARGPSAVTVRAIAEEAGVTQGMIRHYFSSKQDLMNAAYQAHMQVQTEMSQATHDSGGGTARQRLARLIHASVTPPVAEPMALSLWAGFIHMVRRDSAMRVTHEKTYLHYRDLLQVMITAAIAETGRKVSIDEARSLAIACNAVIDGLWLEGGALPDAFDSDELSQIGLRSVEAIIGLSLTGERA